MSVRVLRKFAWYGTPSLTSLEPAYSWIIHTYINTSRCLWFQWERTTPYQWRHEKGNETYIVSSMWKSNPSTSYRQSFAAVKFALKKYAFTNLLLFNFIRKSVDATVHMRKMEARASRDYSQKRSTNYCRWCTGQSPISFRKRTEFLLPKSSLSMVAL